MGSIARILKEQKDNWLFFLLLFTLFYLFAVLLLNNVATHFNQHYSWQAKSFLQGRLDLVPPLPDDIVFDTVKVGNLFYWPLGPFPGIVLIPFVFLFQLLGFFFYQGYLHIFLTFLIFFLSFSLARKNNFSYVDALYLAAAFVFGSVYHWIALVSTSWFFAHAIAVSLLFLCLFEYFHKRRFWVIGILLGLTFMSRFTAGLGVLFFAADILFDRNYNRQTKIRFAFQLLLPVVIAGIILLGFNFLRFGNWFDNGYRAVNAHLLSEADRFELLNYGLFQLRNIPTNLYYYFVKMPDPVRLPVHGFHGPTYILKPPYIKVDYPGVSFFVVSPIFLYLFRLNFKEKLVRLAAIPVSVILLTLLMYFWPGWLQTGPRYLLDLLPFAFLMLFFAFPERRLSFFAQSLILVSAFFNFFLTTTFPS